MSKLLSVADTSSKGLGSNTDFLEGFSSSADGLISDKFNQIKDKIGETKYNWFKNSVIGDNIWRMSKNKPLSNVTELTPAEKKAVLQRVDEDLKDLYAATKNAAAFKKYFFDDVSITLTRAVSAK